MYSSVNLKKRIIALSIVFLLGFFVIIGRLYVVQVHNSKFLQSKALDQWLRDIPTQAKRGAITDRNGLSLVSSYSVYDIYVRHTLVEDVDHEAEIYANVLNLDKEQVKNRTFQKISANLRVLTPIQSGNSQRHWQRHR